MDRNKGLKHIFTSWNILYNKYKDLCPPLWLVGGSLPEIEMIRSDFKEINSDLSTLEQYGKVVWWGCIDPCGLSTVLLRTSVLLMHSLYEPGGRVAVEAMCEGVPVIGTPNGFVKDTITDWYNGFLVEFGDVATLSARMEHFIRQPYLSNTLGENAVVAARKVMDSWQFIEKHLECYFDCESVTLSKGNARPAPSQKEINLYPYCRRRYSDEAIKQFFHKCTGRNAE
ncbi:MAG: glycosyltransferase, partial [Muribaculaceae bacterium]|nr:glycosyltransferase [Muribaculaceae bacterium]